MTYEYFTDKVIPSEPIGYFMAEYGWGISSETEKKARIELNEVPERRKLAIEAVKEQMITRPDIG